MKQLQDLVHGLQKECDDVYAEQKAAHRRAGVAEHHCISWMWEYAVCRKRYDALRDAVLKAETGAELYGDEYKVCAEYWDALMELARGGEES